MWVPSTGGGAFAASPGSPAASRRPGTTAPGPCAPPSPARPPGWRFTQTPTHQAAGVSLGGDGAEVVVGDGDHDAPARGVGAPRTHGAVGGEGLVGAVVVVDANKSLAGGGGVAGLEGADRDGERGVDARVGRKLGAKLRRRGRGGGRGRGRGEGKGEGRGRPEARARGGGSMVSWRYSAARGAGAACVHLRQAAGWLGEEERGELPPRGGAAPRGGRRGRPSSWPWSPGPGSTSGRSCAGRGPAGRAAKEGCGSAVRRPAQQPGR